MVLCCSALTISDCEAAQRWGCYAPSAGKTPGSLSALCHGCNRDFPSGPVCPQCGNAVYSHVPSSAHTGMDRPDRGEDVEGPELSGNGHWGCPSYPTIPVMIAKRNAITSNQRISPTTIPRGERMRKLSVSRLALMMLLARQFRAATLLEGRRSHNFYRYSAVDLDWLSSGKTY